MKAQKILLYQLWTGEKLQFLFDCKETAELSLKIFDSVAETCSLLDKRKNSIEPARIETEFYSIAQHKKYCTAAFTAEKIAEIKQGLVSMAKTNRDLLSML